MTSSPNAPQPQAIPVRSKLRAIRQDDVEGVMDLFQRQGWALRSPAGWNWALFQNPARQNESRDAGWVLESEGRVVGFLGNVPASFSLNGQPILGATCTSLLVDERHRGRGMALTRAFTAQPGMAFVYSATANANSAPLYKAYGYSTIGDGQANQRLRWIISRAALARAGLERAHLGWLMPRVGSGSTWRASQPGRLGVDETGLYVDRVRLSDLTNHRNAACRAAWNSWAQELASGPGLWPDRSARTLSWRLADPDLAEDELALFALRDHQGRVLGSSLIRRLPHQHGQPVKAELMDLAVLPRSGDVGVSFLLSASQRWARGQGAAILDAKRWTGVTANSLAGLGALAQPLPPDAIWLRSDNRPDGSPWVLGSQWSMTGCDSDDWFNTLRPRLKAEEPGPAAGTPIAAAQATKAPASDCTSSSRRSTSEGSKRSMSIF